MDRKGGETLYAEDMSMVFDLYIEGIRNSIGILIFGLLYLYDTAVSYF